MSDAQKEYAHLAPRANELYWETSISVNQIADELELSKGALYGLIEPLASGLPSPHSDAEMVYPNRTARDRGFLVDPVSGHEEDEETLREKLEHAGIDVPPPPVRTAEKKPVPPSDRRATTQRVIAGTALLGVAAGIIIAGWARKN